jgi:beta-phosphoglucomutase-like phosphatase (HAD superfamily)
VILAVLFDLDGMLVKTEELKAVSHARSVTELKPDITEDEVVSVYTNELVGHLRQEVAETLEQRFRLKGAARERMEELGVEEPWQVLVSIRRGIYDEILGESDMLLEQRYTHNIELLHELRGEGYPTACAAMSRRPQVEHDLDVVATMDDVERGKPDPEIDLLVAKKLGVPPEEFLIIEDSRAGVEAAVATGSSSSRCRPG